MAAIDLTTHQTIDWIPTVEGAVYTISVSQNKIFIGGILSSVGAYPRKGLAAFDAKTKKLTSWVADLSATDGYQGDPAKVTAMTSIGNKLYVGGRFTTINQQTLGNLGVIDIVTGEVSGCGTSLSIIEGITAVNTLATEGNFLYVGGNFRTSTSNYLICIDPYTKTTVPWNHGLDGLVNVLAVSQDKQKIYIGGSFSTFGGKTRLNAASFLTATRQVSDWQPNPTTSGTYKAFVKDIALQDKFVYLAGFFTKVNHTDRSYLAAIDTATGIMQNWKPAISLYINCIVPSGKRIFIAGSFSQINSLYRRGLAGIDSTTGLSDSWEVPFTSNYVTYIHLKKHGNVIYASKEGSGFSAYNENFIETKPVISSFSPLKRPVSDTVVIRGKRFGKTISENVVKFNGILAKVIQVYTDSLKVIIPKGATTGRISFVTPGGYAESATDFGVILLPEIVEFYPAFADVGNQVTVLVRNFDASPFKTEILFNGKTITPLSINNGEIRFIIPQGAVSGKLTVSNIAGVSQSKKDLIVVPLPVIKRLMPNSGVAGTTIVKIFGSKFGNNVLKNSVNFNGKTAQILTASDTLLTVVVPQDATTGIITITVDTLADNTERFGNFRIYCKPVHTNPCNSGIITSVKITNVEKIIKTDFVNNSTCESGAFSEKDLYADSGQNNFLLMGFNYTFSITTNANTSLSLWIDNNNNNVFETDEWTSLATSTRPGIPTEVQIKIPNVGNIGYGNYRMRIRSRLAGALNEAEDACTPFDSGETEDYLFVPTIIGYIPPIQISSLVPSRGKVGTAVNIYGNSFLNVPEYNEVKFGNIPAKVLGFSANNTIIQVTVPEGASTERVGVKNYFGTALSPTFFTVLKMPVITDFSPKIGKIGTIITIRGKNFDTEAQYDTISFNGFKVIAQKATDTTIVVKIPEKAATGKISITTGGGITESRDIFNVIPPPIILDFSPKTGGIGTKVAIKGKNFNNDINKDTLRFNNTITFPIQSTDTLLIANVPNNATTGKISITTENGNSISMVNFTVTQAPVIAGVSPLTVSSGAVITISGFNFDIVLANNIVTIDGIVAQILSATSTILTVVVPNGITTGKLKVSNTKGTAESEKDLILQPNALENSIFNDILVYPNPTEDKLTIDFSKTFLHCKRIAIKDILGNEIIWQSATGKAIESVNLKDLLSGIYLLYIETKEGASNMKIIRR